MRTFRLLEYQVRGNKNLNLSSGNGNGKKKEIEDTFLERPFTNQMNKMKSIPVARTKQCLEYCRH